MEWSNDLVIQLIEKYRERPYLWDPKDKNYKLKSKKSDGWKEIGDFFSCETGEAKKKMHSLLSSFRREPQRQVKSGAGADEVYNSSWLAFKSMLFLMDKFTPRNTRSAHEADEKEISLDDDESEDLSSVVNYEEPVVSISEKDEIIEVPSTSNEKTQEFKSLRKPVLGKGKAAQDPRVDAAYKLLEQTVSTHTLRDQSYIFGEHVAAKHRKYSDYTKSMIEHLISNILFDADMGKYNQPNTGLLSVTVSSAFPLHHSQQSSGYSQPLQASNLGNNNIQNRQSNSSLSPESAMSQSILSSQTYNSPRFLVRSESFSQNLSDNFENSEEEGNEDNRGRDRENQWIKK